MSESWQDFIAQLEDRYEFEHAGLKCLILRSPDWGHLCGYVGITEGHPWFEKECNQCLIGCKGQRKELGECLTWDCTWEEEHPSPQSLIEVHGGLTFSGLGDGEWRPAGYWWFGFDCAHAGDLIPEMAEQMAELFPDSLLRPEVYKDMKYVIGQTKCLAEQLAKVNLRAET